MMTASLPGGPTRDSNGSSHRPLTLPFIKTVSKKEERRKGKNEETKVFTLSRHTMVVLPGI